MRVCYVAYSCSPYGGSEEAIGWNLSMAMASYADVTVITKEEQRAAIEDYIERFELPGNISFVFCDIPTFFKRVFKGGLYSGRLNLWLEAAAAKAREMHSESPFDVLHQITPVEFRALGDYDLPGCKLVAGPLGGGEYAPSQLERYLDCEKRLERIRRLVNEATLRSPSWHRRFRAYDSVLFANEETMAYLNGHGVIASGGEVRTEIGVSRNAYEAARSFGGHGERGVHSPLRLLFMGRLVPRKGVELLLDVCCKLKQEEVSFELRVCGEGRQDSYLQSVCGERNLASDVEFLGGIPHESIGEEYEWCDIVVMPSLRETGGTIIAEALSRLKPVVAFDAFGAKTILADAPFCRFAETNEDCASSFADAIVQTAELASVAKADDYFPYLEFLCWDNKASYFANLYRFLLCDRKGANRI